MAKKDDKLKEEEKEEKEEEKKEQDINDLETDELEEAIEVEKESVEKPEEEKEETEEETEEVEELEEGETKEETEEPKVEIPDKLEGKSKEDIVRMYMDAEKRMHGATQNEAQYKKKSEQYRKMLSDKYEFNEEGEIIGSKSSPEQQKDHKDHWEVLEQQTGIPRENLKPLMGIFNAQLQQREKALQEKIEPLMKEKNKSKYQQVKDSLKSDLEHMDKYEKEMDKFVEERKIPYDSLNSEDAVKTIYHTILGQHYNEAVEKKKNKEAKLKADSEKEKSEARVEQSTKTPVETSPDFDNMSRDDQIAYLEKKLPKQDY